MKLARRALAISITTLSLCTLAACGGPPDMPARAPTAALPSTPAIDHKSGFFNGKNGVSLFEQSWRPHDGKVHASFVIMHGLKDHSSRYEELAELLASQGVAVHAFDLRGHGRSAGVRVGVDSFEDYVDDLDAFVTRVNADEHNAPVFVFGHSMGGAIVTLYALEKKPHLAGLILSGAALTVNVAPVKVFGTTLVAGLAPNAGVFQLDVDQFSRDPKVVADGKNDPLVYQDGAPAHTAKELLSAIGKIDDHMSQLFVPLLILHGGDDMVTDPRGSEMLYEKTPSSDRTLRIYPKLFHDLIHEPEKKTVLFDITQWTESHIRALEARSIPPAQIASKSDSHEDDHAAPAALAPRPFTAEQIRAASKNGRMYVWKRETAKGEPELHEMVFSNIDDEHVTLTSTARDMSGKAKSAPEIEHLTWKDLLQHTSFPRDATTIDAAPIELAAGRFECMHYTIKSKDGVMHFYFAKDLPGAPVFFTKDVDGARVMTQTLVGYRDAEGAAIKK